MKWSMHLSCNGVYSSGVESIRNNSNNNAYFLLCSHRAPSDRSLLHSVGSCTILLKLHSNSRHSWEQNGALSARSRQCHLVQSAYKILHLPAAQENGRDTDNTQEGSRSPATALWFEEKRLCLPDTWSCYRGGMLWGALWPLLLCVCINTTAVVIIIANTRVI